MRILVLERMASFAVRDIAERILDSALARAGLAFVPMGGARLTSFAHGALQDLVRHHLGDDAADALLEDLQPLLRLHLDDDDVSSIRPRGAEESQRVATAFAPDDDGPITDTISQPQMRAVDRRTPEVPAPLMAGPTVRPQQTSGALVVIVATLDPGRGHLLGVALGHDAAVHVVDDLVALVDTAQELAEHRPLLVLDGTAPALHAATFAATLPELPEGAGVVLWGFDRPALDEMHALVDGARAFRSFGPDVDEIELAATLRLY